MRHHLRLATFAVGIGLQAADLHLILGTTNTHGVDQFETAIASVNSDGSVAIRKEIFGARAGSTDGLGWIDTNFESRRAVILRAGPGDEHTGEMIVIDFDSADVVKTCRRVSAAPGLGPTYEYLIDHPVHGLMLTVLFHGNRQDQLVGRIVDPAVGCEESRVVLENSAILGYVSDGSAGVGAGGASNSLSTGFEDHRLRSILSQDRIYFPRIPDDLLAGFSPPTSSGIAVRNRRLEVVWLSMLAPGSREGKTRVLLHDRIREQWTSLPIAQDESPGGMRAFGDWIAWQQAFSERALVRKRPGITPVRPGSQDFRENETRWGKAAIYGIRNENVYTGVLNLYDATTGRHITFDTKHGDSEVLLVSGSTVYYRSSDRLFKVELTADGVSKPKLIAKSELIRDAHWAFTSTATQDRRK